MTAIGAPQAPVAPLRPVRGAGERDSLFSRRRPSGKIRGRRFREPEESAPR
jgi:hypothetical protein